MKYIFISLMMFMYCNHGNNNTNTEVPTTNPKCPGLNHQDPELVGGPCEGCDAVFEFGENIPGPVDTLPDFNNQGQKIKIFGTIFKPGGNEPACDVILYLYHTNQEGIYPTKEDEIGWDRRHGYIRGWVKTDVHGKYTFYTLKPGTYPSRTEPAHIHITLLEPNGKYYWLESYLFEDDPLLKSTVKNQENVRGGHTNILKLRKEQDLLAGTRDIELGKNISDYE